MDGLCTEMGKENNNTCPDEPSLIRGFCDEKTCKATYYEGVHCPSATNELGCKNLRNWYEMNCKESGKNCAGAPWQKSGKPFLKNFCQSDQNPVKINGEVPWMYCAAKWQKRIRTHALMYQV